MRFTLKKISALSSS